MSATGLHVSLTVSTSADPTLEDLATLNTILAFVKQHSAFVVDPKTARLLARRLPDTSPAGVRRMLAATPYLKKADADRRRTRNRVRVVDALRVTRGDTARAAELLGIRAKTVRRWLHTYDIQPSEIVGPRSPKRLESCTAPVAVST